MAWVHCHEKERRDKRNKEEDIPGGLGLLRRQGFLASGNAIVNKKEEDARCSSLFVFSFLLYLLKKASFLQGAPSWRLKPGKEAPKGALRHFSDVTLTMSKQGVGYVHA